MSILVTGGLGFIGSHVVLELLNLDYKVIIIDNLSNSYIDILDHIETITSKRPLFYKGNINDSILLDDIFSKHDVDTVIHLAGYKSVGESVSDPLKYYQNNVNGLIILLTCMNRFSIKKIIFSSSATVYGNPTELPINEESPINILNPYGQSKRMSELILEDSSKAYNISVVSLRYFNPVGGHSSGLLNENPCSAPTNLFPVIISVYNRKKEYLEVFGNDYDTKDGTCIRDYIHVVDLAIGHIKALEFLNNNNKYELFNLGTGNGYSVLDIIDKFEHHTGKKLNYQIEKKRPGDYISIYSNCEKANNLLGWYPGYNLDDMIKSSIILINKPVTTFVTAFLTVKDYKNPGKSVDGYFDHFIKLVNTGIPLSVYISPDHKERMEEIARNNSNVIISKVIDIKDTWIYNTVNTENIQLPINRNHLKDTFEYFVCINTKIECLQDTVQQNPFHTDYFCWLDFGLFYVFDRPTDSINMLKKISTTALIDDEIILPGCWNKNNYNYTQDVLWRFCGGVIAGHKKPILDMWDRYRHYLPIFINKYNLATWEVNFWVFLELESNWSPKWYKADHNSKILDVPDEFFILK
jgi:UDP-glucose 4-epimerase